MGRSQESFHKKEIQKKKEKKNLFDVFPGDKADDDQIIQSCQATHNRYHTCQRDESQPSRVFAFLVYTPCSYDTQDH